jgi:hypothetical protein
MDDDNTFTITSPANDYDCTVDVTGDLDWGTLSISSTSTPSYAGSTTTISLDDLIITDEKRTSVRDSGELPIDIWAKMYNNGVIDDE